MQNSLIKTDLQTKLSHLVEDDFFSLDGNNHIFKVCNAGTNSVHVSLQTDYSGRMFFSFPKDLVVQLWSWRN